MPVVIDRGGGDPKATLGEVVSSATRTCSPKPLDTALSQLWELRVKLELIAMCRRARREPAREEAELLVGLAARASHIPDP